MSLLSGAHTLLYNMLLRPTIVYSWQHVLGHAEGINSSAAVPYEADFVANEKAATTKRNKCGGFSIVEQLQSPHDNRGGLRSTTSSCSPPVRTHIPGATGVKKEKKKKKTQTPADQRC